MLSHCLDLSRRHCTVRLELKRFDLDWKISTTHRWEDSLWVCFCGDCPCVPLKTKNRKSFWCDRSQNMYLRRNDHSASAGSFRAQQIFRHWIDIDTTTRVRVNRNLSKYSTETALRWCLVIHNCHLRDIRTWTFASTSNVQLNQVLLRSRTANFRGKKRTGAHSLICSLYSYKKTRFLTPVSSSQSKAEEVRFKQFLAVSFNLPLCLQRGLQGNKHWTSCVLLLHSTCARQTHHTRNKRGC